MYLLPYGVIIGFSIGIFFRPIAVLCIRRSIMDGFWMGIATGFGASLAHIIFGSIAAFGLVSLKQIFISYGIWLRLAGSIYLLYLAFRAATRPAIVAQQTSQTMSYPQAIVSTFLLNLTNPVVIASYAAFLSMFNLSIISITGGIALLIGIFSGNFSVWIILCGACRLLRTYSSKMILEKVNIGAAILLASFGFVGVATSIYAML